MINSVKSIITTPFKFASRYMGSKNQFAPSGYSRKSTELTAEKAKKFIPYIAMTEACLSSDQRKLEGLGLTIIRPNIENLPKTIEVRNLCFVNKKSGLKVTLIQSATATHAVFGSAFSMKSEMEKNESPAKALICQFIAGAKNIVGLNPAIFDEAEKTFLALQKQYPEISIVGGSLGGSLAAYVGLRQKVKTVTINGLPIGAGLQQNIEKNTLREANNLIKNFHVKNDTMSDHSITNLFDRVLSLSRIRTPGLFGKRFSIPSGYKTYTFLPNNKTHEFVMGSLMNFLGYDRKTRPHEIGLHLAQQTP